MKRSSFLISVLLVLCSTLSAATNDYINGYLQGYNDGKAGIEARYEKPLTTQTESDLRIQYFVDEVGDPTTQGYITQKQRANGTFSNSATTNSDITWYIIAAPEPEQVAFVIFEYSRTRLTGSSGFPDEYRINVKTEDGRMLHLSGKNYSDRISLNKEDASTLRSELMKDQILKISIVEQTRFTASSYNLGALNTTGFSSLYSQLLNNQ